MSSYSSPYHFKIENNDKQLTRATTTIDLISYDKITYDIFEPKKIVYEALKVQGFSCPSCNGTEFDEIDTGKIKCRHCGSMFNCKLE